jgi:hypothetical protein
VVSWEDIRAWACVATWTPNCAGKFSGNMLLSAFQGWKALRCHPHSHVKRACIELELLVNKVRSEVNYFD